MDLFFRINSSKGRAICRLALVRVQWEQEFWKEDQLKNISNFISVAEKAKQQFSKIGYKFGEQRANQYIEILKK